MPNENDEFEIEPIDIADIDARFVVDASPATAANVAQPDPAARNPGNTLAAAEMSHQGMRRAEVGPAAAHRDEGLEEERLQAEEERFEAEEAEDQELEAYEAQLEANREAEQERQEQEAREREEREREEEEREEREREEQEDDSYDDDGSYYAD